jgi:galactose mutarotase-like enzyme
MNALEHEGSTLRLASDALSVGVVSLGARVTSLVSRCDGREWLTQSKGASVAPRYGARFTDTDHFGWDEMFPSVETCRYPVEPFTGIDVADHGELWSVPWATVEASSSSITQRVRSDRFSYTFERTLALDGATLRAEYVVVLDDTVTTAQPMLWALHPQFAMTPGARVELQGDRTHVLDTSDPSSVRPVEWLGDLKVERDVEPGCDRMVYVTPGEPISEARIVDPNNSTLRLSWDRSFAPYLGVWMDRGRYTDGLVVAIEPTNGFFDELARAHQAGTVRCFAPAERVTWWVQLNFEQGDS